MKAGAGSGGAVKAPARRSWVDRAIDATPLVAAYLLLIVLYGWQSRWQTTPWMFSDELEYSGLARSVAATGHLALRGEARPFGSLYPYVTAPAWLIDNVQTAYAAAKYLSVLIMAAVVFPAYLLARLAVNRPLAFFAAVASAAIPAMTYSAYMVEEPLAYPYATLCLYLIARSLARRDRRSIALAAVFAIGAPLVRQQLVVIPATMVACLLVLAWLSEPARRWRERWKVWDWIGAVVLALGAFFLASRLLGSYDEAWTTVTGHFRRRMIDYGGWALGATLIGLGVAPLVLGLAGLLSRRRGERSREERALTVLILTALPVFLLYAAVKAAYLSTTFATRVEERNLIYAAPLAFAAFAVFLAHPRLRLLPLAASAGLALLLVFQTPYEMQLDFYWDAPGLAILQGANRQLGWTASPARSALLGVLVLTVVIGLLPRLTRRLVALPVLGVAAVGVLAWTATGEVAAADGTRRHAEFAYKSLPRPLDWVDRAAHGRPVLYLGQGLESTGATEHVYFTEFWNRSIAKVWSLDGTAPGPGATLTPNHDVQGRLVDGEWKPVGTGFAYVLTDGPIDLVGKVVARRVGLIGGGQNSRRLLLWKAAQPLRIRYEALGLEKDGWISARSQGEDMPPKFESSYDQFSVPGDRRVAVQVVLSRKAWCGPAPPSPVEIQVGKLTIGPDKQPALGRVTDKKRWLVRSCSRRVFTFPAPATPFRVDVRAWRPFVPAEISDRFSYEKRPLTTMVSYRVVPLDVLNAKRRRGS
jgi:hypothetical protein